MNGGDKRGERTVALALLGAVLFSTPLLSGFGGDEVGFLFGIPALYLYLFVAWGLLIFLLALAVDLAKAKSPDADRPEASDESNGPGGA